ncbi:MAG TPA: hypothetical protein PLK11_04550 [Methanofastidiosum sp.]|jgi:hypothetical protein|nr:hypothetical protein [Methanofastidiosum sp.]HOR88458.1 hypothetical protein [Methanofastidiosum sp.]HPL00601.1 hypothetical protein [Methanofastidiosum sp.]
MVVKVRPKNTIRALGYKIILAFNNRLLINRIFIIANILTNQINNIEIILEYQILKIVYHNIYN